MTENRGENGNQSKAEKKTAQGISGAQLAAAIGLASSLVGVLAFFGISNFTQLRQALFPTPALSGTASPNVTNDPFTHDALTSSPTPSPSPTTATPFAPSTPAFDPDWLNSAQTDPTPFAEAALLAQSFTDSNGIHYSLVASSPEECLNARMSMNVQNLLNSSGGCKTTMGDYVMTGQYLEDGSGVTERNDVLVSVQVFPLDSASTALQVYKDLSADGSWNFGFWCPGVPAAAVACDRGYSAFSSAFQWQFIRSDHRYLIAADAVYVDLTQDSSIKPWVVSASSQACNVSGPENFSGNQ